MSSQIPLYSLENKAEGKVTLPSQFSEPVRTDLIHRAVISIQANNRQPYGSDREAGIKHVSRLSRRRRKYRGSYGKGISRVPRKIHSRSGTQMGWVGALAPMTVGGRRAHPPKVETVWSRKINVQERRKAVRSALAATLVAEMVKAHGHKVPAHYPFALDSKSESIKNTKQVFDALHKLGLTDELMRTSEKQARAGKGKMRGRRFREKAGPLLVVSKDCDLVKAGRNIPGVDVCVVDRLNAELLAPGAVAGRLTLFTEAALKRMADAQLFLHKKEVKAEKKAKK
jgi:large subunit ribosomal protein L4e